MSQAELESKEQDIHNEAKETKQSNNTNNNSFHCAVCFEDYDDIKLRANLPCCGRNNSSTSFCYRCIQIICEQSPGQVGR